VKEKIVFREGTHRIRLPEETLSIVMPHMAAMGITRIADVTGLDTMFADQTHDRYLFPRARGGVWSPPGLLA